MVRWIANVAYVWRILYENLRESKRNIEKIYKMIDGNKSQNINVDPFNLNSIYILRLNKIFTKSFHFSIWNTLQHSMET